MGKKRKLKSAKEDEFEFDPVPKHLVTAHLKNQEKRLIIILEDAQLETVKVSCLTPCLGTPCIDFSTSNRWVTSLNFSTAMTMPTY